MIRIRVSDPKAIEEAFVDDARKAQNGAFKAIKKYRRFLKKCYPKLHQFLFLNGNYEQNVTKLLLSDRTQMEQYIRSFEPREPDTSRYDTQLSLAFNYQSLSKRAIIRKLLESLDSKVCPYCNRQYVVVTAAKGPRPQLDHFFPKSKYPYLAVSLWNLIPCCACCNQCKSSLDTFSKKILYPYDEEFGDRTVFSTNPAKGSGFYENVKGLTDKFTIEIKRQDGSVLDEAEKEQIETMRLHELYEQHKDYVMDIRRNEALLTDDFFTDMNSKFPTLFPDPRHMKDALFMSLLSSELLGKRPLSKLTRDILQQDGFE